MRVGEIKQCIELFRYIKKNMLETQPEIYTRLCYNSDEEEYEDHSLNFVKLGVMYDQDKKEWLGFIRPRGTNEASERSFPQIDQFIKQLNDAFEIIKSHR